MLVAGIAGGMAMTTGGAVVFASVQAIARHGDSGARLRLMQVDLKPPGSSLPFARECDAVRPEADVDRTSGIDPGLD